MGGARAPPAPPWLRYCYRQGSTSTVEYLGRTSDMMVTGHH